MLVYQQMWEEVKEDGINPEGCTLHEDMESLLLYKYAQSEYNEDDDYCRPCGEPRAIEVSKQIFESVADCKVFRLFADEIWILDEDFDTDDDSFLFYHRIDSHDGGQSQQGGVEVIRAFFCGSKSEDYVAEVVNIVVDDQQIFIELEHLEEVVKQAKAFLEKRKENVAS